MIAVFLEMEAEAALHHELESAVVLSLVGP